MATNWAGIKSREDNLKFVEYILLGIGDINEKEVISYSTL